MTRGYSVYYPRARYRTRYALNAKRRVVVFDVKRAWRSFMGGELLDANGRRGARGHAGTRARRGRWRGENRDDDGRHAAGPGAGASAGAAAT